MTERIPCPNCSRPIAYDLNINANERGYTNVSFGVKCRACGTLYVDEAIYVRDVEPMGAGVTE